MAISGRMTAAGFGPLIGRPSASYLILLTVSEITKNIPITAGTTRIRDTTKNTAASTRNASSRSENSAKGRPSGVVGLGGSGRKPGGTAYPAGGTPSCPSCGFVTQTVLQVPATFLLPLDGLEERLEVALAEAERAMPLDQLEEHRRPVLDRLGEDLQQVPVFVAVDQDLPGLEFLDRHADRADAGAQFRVLVVGVGGVEELDAGRPHLVDRAQDVVGGQGDVLGAGAAVELEVLVDLRLLAPGGRLVQRELDLAAAARDDLAHQRRVVGGDVVADELGHVREAHDPVVELDPLVHGAQLDVADHVVDRLEQPRRGARPPDVRRRPRHEPGQVWAGVARAVDER